MSTDGENRQLHGPSYKEALVATNRGTVVSGRSDKKVSNKRSESDGEENADDKSHEFVLEELQPWVESLHERNAAASTYISEHCGINVAVFERTIGPFKNDIEKCRDIIEYHLMSKRMRERYKLSSVNDSAAFKLLHEESGGPPRPFMAFSARKKRMKKRNKRWSVDGSAVFGLLHEEAGKPRPYMVFCALSFALISDEIWTFLFSRAQSIGGRFRVGKDERKMIIDMLMEKYALNGKQFFELWKTSKNVSLILGWYASFNGEKVPSIDALPLKYRPVLWVDYQLKMQDGVGSTAVVVTRNKGSAKRDTAHQLLQMTNRGDAAHASNLSSDSDSDRGSGANRRLKTISRRKESKGQLESQQVSRAPLLNSSTSDSQEGFLLEPGDEVSRVDPKELLDMSLASGSGESRRCSTSQWQTGDFAIEQTEADGSDLSTGGNGDDSIDVDHLFDFESDGDDEPTSATIRKMKINTKAVQVQAFIRQKQLDELSEAHHKTRMLFIAFVRSTQQRFHELNDNTTDSTLLEKKLVLVAKISAIEKQDRLAARLQLVNQLTDKANSQFEKTEDLLRHMTVETFLQEWEDGKLMFHDSSSDSDSYSS
ncbi:hypothetical protein MPSEU_000889300 [Mayamaea pseudoterrestris]|nr:hypothetical protein MPSEU_000889300 [Mayamaea pseudoterrestris]